MHKPSGPTRRDVLTAGAAIAATLGGASQASAKTPTRAEGGADCAPEIRLTTPPNAVVKTTAGSVRGFMRGPIYIFKGIPFGMDTGGAARFLPPQAAAPWRVVSNRGPTHVRAAAIRTARVVLRRVSRTHRADDGVRP